VTCLRHARAESVLTGHGSIWVGPAASPPTTPKGIPDAPAITLAGIGARVCAESAPKEAR